jgi:hypothetical protein
MLPTWIILGTNRASIAVCTSRCNGGDYQSPSSFTKTRSNVGDYIGADDHWESRRSSRCREKRSWAVAMLKAGSRREHRTRPQAPGAERRRSRRSIYLNNTPIVYPRVITRLMSLRRLDLVILVSNVSVGFENRSLNRERGMVQVPARGEAARP